MVALKCFKKENLHSVWDDSLVGKAVICADSLSNLYERLESDYADVKYVTPSPDNSYPFKCDQGVIWRFAYVLGESTFEPGGDPVKKAYMEGLPVLRRYRNGDEDWEYMDELSYFDLPGYEYKLESGSSLHRVSNKELAKWLAKGKGMLLDTSINLVSTSCTFKAYDMECEVPAGYKVMPMGSDDWLEPTEDVICGE